MIEAFLIFLFWLACVAAIIIVHESGHFLAGWIGGIPLRAMRVRLFTFPQHVVLRHGDDWVSPADFEAYRDACWQHLKSTHRVWCYVAGGLCFETLVTCGLAVAFVHHGLPKLAFFLVLLSTIMGLPWLIIEPILVKRTGNPAGDVSALWQLATIPTVLFLIVGLSLRGIVLWYSA